MRKTNPSTQISHVNTNSDILLEDAIKPANTVIYFTHDYYSFVPEKNAQLKQTAEICKAYNVDKLIAVNPIEFVNYYNNNGFSEDPLADESKAHDEAISIFKKTVILRSNLIFGTNSYLVRYLMQNWMENNNVINNPSYKSFRFNPLYTNDLNNMIGEIVNNNKNFEGKKLIANGGESLSFLDVDNMLKQTYSSTKESSQPNSMMKKMMFNWQIFFNGNTHVTNFEYFLEYLNHSNPQFNEYENMAKVLDMKPASFREYYTNKGELYKAEKVSEGENGDLRYPQMEKYWGLSLD